MTRLSASDRRFDDDCDGADKEREREHRFNRLRFGRDVRRYGYAPPTPPPLPERKPIAFPEPTKYEERNGG